MRITSELPLRTRRAVLAAGAAALVGCAALGAVSLNVASAESSPAVPVAFSSPANAEFVSLDSAQIKQEEDKFINTLASKLGVTSDKLQKALKETQQEVGPGPVFFGGGKEGFGMQVTAISITGDLTSAAKTIGISEDKLRKELVGKSLTDVAKAHNVDQQKVASAIRTARLADLDQAVQAGKLPADMATTIKSNLDKEIEMLMTIVRPAEGAFGEFHVRSERISSDAPAR